MAGAVQTAPARRLQAGDLAAEVPPAPARAAPAAQGSRSLTLPARPVLVVSLSATLLALLITAVGRWWVAPGVAAGARFWASCFFVLLLWPIGLSLLGHLAGIRVQAATAAGLLVLTVVQQAGNGSLPVPEVVSWSVTLAAPGEAIRRQIDLPSPEDRAWQRAWREARQVVVAVCTQSSLPAAANVVSVVNDAPPQSLADAPRIGKPDAIGWYYVPVSRAALEAQRELEVVLRREGAAGGPAVFCGGQDDPTRPGYGQSWRLRGGQWSAENLADLPIPPVKGQVPPQRYYVELRFLDAHGLPHVAIWY